MALRLNFFNRYAAGRGALALGRPGRNPDAPRPTPRLRPVPPRRARASLRELSKSASRTRAGPPSTPRAARSSVHEKLAV
jgi:hypothetical protein